MGLIKPNLKKISIDIESLRKYSKFTELKEELEKINDEIVGKNKEKTNSFSIFDEYADDDVSNNTGSTKTSEPVATTYTEDSSSSVTPQKTDGVYINGKTSENGYGPEFLSKVDEVAKNHNMTRAELLALMYSESGLNARNSTGSCWGLTQMSSDTCRLIGTTQSQLVSMSPTEQMNYVDKWFTYLENQGCVNKSTATAADYYSANFLPYRAKKDVLTTSNESYYKWNSGLDLDKDGDIDKKDIQRRLDSCHVDESSFSN